MLLWMNFNIKDAIDILLAAFFLYKAYQLMKASGNTAIFSGIISFIIVWILVSQVLEMKLMGAILDKFISVGFFVLIILFQDDIRRFLLALGSHRGLSFLSSIFKRKGYDAQPEGQYIAPVVLAVINMAKKKTGALIVIQKEMDLTSYAHTGEIINANVNARLIENIFFKNSPLHDGAMVIADNRIEAAGCILPIAQHIEISKELGLRHRAGLGMTQETDAKVIIVSEERGKISVAQNGKLNVNISAEELQAFLSE